MMSTFNRNGTTALSTPGSKLDMTGNGAEPALAGGPQNVAARRNPLLVLWQRRWLVVICLAVALMGAIAYLVVATPIYESRAQVLVEQNTPRIIASDPTGASTSQPLNYLWTQCAVLRSRAILDAVAEQADVKNMESFTPGMDVIEQLRLMVNPTVGRRDDVITIAVRSRIPKDAARIANLVVEAFTRYHDATRRSTAHEVLDLLNTKKVELDKELDAKRKAKLEFQTKYSGFSLGSDRVNPALERMATLSSALTVKQLATLNAQAAFETAKAMMDDPVKSRQLLETRQFKSETAQLRTELRDLQQKMAGMSKNYLPGYPELTAIQQSIKQLSDEMAAEDRKIVEAYVAELEAQVQAAKREEEHVAALLAEQQNEVKQLNTVAAQYSLLQSELDGLERFSEEIYTRIKTLSLTEDAGALNVQMVEAAVVEDKPVSPNKATTLFLALLMGAAAGAGLAFVRDWTDQRLRSAEEIKQVLGLPVLGIVPHIVDGRTPAARGMFIHNDPMSDVAEAYRTVRTAVYFGQSGSVARTILITSPIPGDGKTTLASNLAIAMAQAGNRILLLDADFRKPTQHKIFEIDKRVGLSSVLAGEAGLDAAIHKTSVAGLDVLPCGPIPANPSEILNSQTFADMIEELMGRYDHILLDSPPIMPVTDARILSASCDATVLALRAERSTRKGAMYARDMLHSVGSQILGVVVNDVPRKKGVYGYYYTYGETYQYGYGHARRALPTDGAGNPKPPLKQQA
jgi:capsular exopolysaccharide synthesis family protein